MNLVTFFAIIKTNTGSQNKMTYILNREHWVTAQTNPYFKQGMQGTQYVKQGMPGRRTNDHFKQGQIKISFNK